MTTEVFWKNPALQNNSRLRKLFPFRGALLGLYDSVGTPTAGRGIAIRDALPFSRVEGIAGRPPKLIEKNEDQVLS